MKKRTGIWVGLDALGKVQAGYVVFGPEDEDYAKEYVTFGSRTVLRVGPEVIVRLGHPLPTEVVAPA